MNFNQLDRLDEARTVQELAAAIKPILQELMYGAITGDMAAGAAHERWHDNYTDALHSAMGRDRAAAAAAAPPVADSGRRRRDPAGGGNRAQGHERMQTRPASAHKPTPMPKRPMPSDVPASLQKLMNSHLDDSEDSC